MNLLDIAIGAFFAKSIQKKYEQSYYESLSRFDTDLGYNDNLDDFNYDIKTKFSQNNFLAGWKKKRKFERIKGLANKKKIQNLSQEEIDSIIKRYC